MAALASREARRRGLPPAAYTPRRPDAVRAAYEHALRVAEAGRVRLRLLDWSKQLTGVEQAMYQALARRDRPAVNRLRVGSDRLHRAADEARRALANLDVQEVEQ